MPTMNKVNTEAGENTRERLLLEQLITGIKNLPEIEPAPHFTAQVMYRIKAQEKTHWFTLPVLPAFTYSFVFIIFCVLGLLLNPLLKNPGPKPTALTNTSSINSSTDYVTPLVESRQLNLIEIQAKSLEMVYNGDPK